jgi:2-succinyl-5-enolpyruvyl-6-hydroxy-3-cyclohexene-1-carboxylate synthase
VVVAGRHERDTPLGQAAAAFCLAAGWPLLADPLSGARRGAAAVGHYDALLRDEAFATSHRPDLVVRVGDLPVSKPLRTWLAGLGGVRQVALDHEGAWQDPASVLSQALALEPAAALAGLTATMAATPAGYEDAQTGASAVPPADPDWLAGWRSADELAAEAINGVLADETIAEPTVAAELGVLLPEAATLFVASSMPVRDVETFWPVREDPPRVLCNRGANGIDGTVSSAFGVAAASDDGRVVLLIGDVALAYDIGGLLAAKRLGLKLTIVLLDNEGGGIFDFLPVSQAAIAHENDVYTRHVATPTGLQFAKAAGLYDLGYERVETIPALRAAMEHALAPQAGSTIVHVKTDRAANVKLHNRVWSAVSQARAAADGDPDNGTGARA